MDEKELKQEIMTADERVNAVVVSDTGSYELAGAMVIDLDRLAKKINAYWEEPIKKAHEAHRALTAKRGEMLKPVEDRKKVLRGKISAYLTEQERIRRAEQTRLDEERRKKEQAERERLEKAAAKAEEKGRDERAEALREKAADVYIPPAVVVPEVEKTTRMDTGTVSQKKSTRVTVTDPVAILRAVVAGSLPIGIVTINETKLKQAVELQGLKQLDGAIIEEIVTAQFRGK